MVLISKISQKLIRILSRIGSLINQAPTKEEKDGLTTSPKFQSHIWEKRTPKIKMPKVHGPMGRKGEVHSDEKIFNHPRR